MNIKIVTLILFVFISFISNAQVSNADALSKHSGESITLCGVVTTVQSSEKVGGNATVVTFNGVTDNVTYTALVSNKLNKSMDYKLEGLSGQNICFTGKIKVNKGKSEIFVSRITDIYKAPSPPIRKN